MRNIQVFNNLNLEEKILRTELVERQQELAQKEKQVKFSEVVRRMRVGKLKQEER